MIDKILFTKKDKARKIDQLSFQMPVGYKLYMADDYALVDTNGPTLIDFGVDVFSHRPATFIYTPAIQSADFRIVDPVQMIAPQQSTPLRISIINPCVDGNNWSLNKGDLLATLVVVETYAVNLFEVSNKVFKQYV